MFVALPLCVGRIVDLVNKDKYARFGGTVGIQVTDNCDGTFTLAATDGKFLGIARGKMNPELACWSNELPGEGENDVRQVIVPASSWKDIFNGGDGDIITIWSDGNNINLNRWDKFVCNRTIRSRAVVEGPFPKWEQIIPKIGPMAVLDVQAPRLADAIRSASKLTAMDDTSNMRIGFYPTFGNNCLIGISGSRWDPDVTFDGLVVPLQEVKPKAKQEPEPEEDEDDDPIGTDEPGVNGQAVEVTEEATEEEPAKVPEELAPQAADAVQGLRDRHRNRRKKVKEKGKPAPETPAS